MKVRTVSIRRLCFVACFHFLAAAPIVFSSPATAEGFGVRGCAALSGAGLHEQFRDAVTLVSNRPAYPNAPRDDEAIRHSGDQDRAGKRRTAAHSKAGATDRQRRMLRCAGPADAAEEDIRGPREAVVIPVPKEFPFVRWLAGAGTLAAVGLLLWLWKRRKARQRAVTPAERALTELEAIDSVRNAMEPGPLADRAAGVVRRFIAERFGIAAPRRTTEEFLHELATGPASPLAGHSAPLRGFLKSCDMAKFAGAGFNAAERLVLLDTARRFIRAAAESSPAPEPPPLHNPAAV